MTTITFWNHWKPLKHVSRPEACIQDQKWYYASGDYVENFNFSRKAEVEDNSDAYDAETDAEDSDDAYDAETDIDEENLKGTVLEISIWLKKTFLI